MIKIQNFKLAYHLYKQDMLDYRLLQDQAAVLLGLCPSPCPAVDNPLQISDTNIDWLLKQLLSTQDYSSLLGGDVNVCEIESDLTQIHGCNFEWAEKHDGNWPNVTDMVMSWDVCEYLEETARDAQWVMFLLCWNNAGGPVYYVPKHLWVKARVTEHIQATNHTINT